MNRYIAKRRGVTLIEMLVVIAIIAILVGISIPNFMIMVRNNRVRARSLAILAAIRNERSRAISLNREIKMEIDGDAKTYTVTRLRYTLYNPLSASLDDPEILDEEEPEIILQNQPFDEGDWLFEDVETSPDPFEVTFTPSGTINIENTPPVATITLQGQNISYQIRAYKGGQVDIF